MRYYAIEEVGELGSIKRKQGAFPELLTDYQVLIKVHAVSLNYKDLVLAMGMLSWGSANKERVPASDFAGEVVDVGSGVTSLSIGDRVVAGHFPQWRRGDPSGKNTKAMGRELAGVLSEYIVLPVDWLLKFPDYLSYEQASTLPCAGVTVWNALVEKARLQSGETVLTMGSGGISSIALQLAKSLGAKVIATTAKESGEDYLYALGASSVINYKEYPQWSKQVLNITANMGVNVVVEVGGPSTFQESLNALAFNGRIAAVGVLTGIGGGFNPTDIIFKSASVFGVYVGSMTMLSDFLEHLDKHKIIPPMDSEVFGFDQVPQAFEKIKQQTHRGKVVIKVT